MKRLSLAVVAALLLAGAVRADDTADLFQKKCAVCHGKDGHATPTGQKMGAKDLTGLADPKGDPKAVADIISNGKGTNMKPFKGKLTDEQILALAKFIRAGLK